MIRRASAALALAALAAPVAAAPHKILVLPTDGTAEPAVRTKLTAQVARLARRLDGQVTIGDATFADAAVAVGCAPDAAGCSDQVLATLGVDELVWATATRGDEPGARVVVHRAAKGSATRERSAVAGDKPDRAGLDAELAPLFGPAEAEPAPAAEPPAAEPAPAPAPPPPVTDDRTASDRTVSLVAGVSAGVALVVGGALWLSYSDLQDQIDSHSTHSRGDIDDLIALEDRAQTRAVLGDVFVIAGLAAGGVAAYFLLRDHQPRTVALVPTPLAHGAGLTLTVRADL